MNMILKKIILDNFKGVVHAEYTMGMFTRISGMNGAGKTTIADAWMWLFFDKNYALASNPDIRPDDGRECVPTVTAVLDVDGTEITAAKMQKMRVSKPDDKGISKTTLTNTYEINSVPKNQKDFIAYFAEHGVDLDKMLSLTNPDVFMGQKTADMRKLLFGMASTRTDQEIAAWSSETSEVHSMLGSYKMDEIKAMETASKKKAQEQLDAIPNQIIGMTKSKIEIDVSALESQKESYVAELESLEKKTSNKSGAVSELQSKAMQLQMDKNTLYAAEKEKIQASKRELTQKLYSAEDERSQAERNVKNITKTIESEKEILKHQQDSLAEMGKKFHENEALTFEIPQNLVFDESAWVFDDSTTVCSLCGQKLPESKIKVLRADFEGHKKAAQEKSEAEIKKLREHFLDNKKMIKGQLITDGNNLKKSIDEISATLPAYEKQLSEEKEHFEQSANLIAKLEEEMKSVPSEPDMSKIEAYLKYVSELQSVESQISELSSKEVDTEDVSIKKQEIQSRIDEINRQLAQVDANNRIDLQIEELKLSIVNYEQAKADAEKILYQLDLVSKKKNELLTNEINQHFKIVKWKLFDYMKNGNYEECCVPMIDGKEYKVSTNTGREIQAKLDILCGLQQFYGQSVPAFLDGAESLNRSNLPVMESQIITLNVVEPLYKDAEGKLHAMDDKYDNSVHEIVYDGSLKVEVEG